MKIFFDVIKVKTKKRGLASRASRGSVGKAVGRRPFIYGRYVSGTEAAWRLQEFPISCGSHSVVRLAIHTENQQQITFEEINPGAALNIGKLL